MAKTHSNFPTIKRATADLIPYANNSRTHSDSQIKQICSSIKEFGFTNPIIIDEDNGIIAGHGRVMAAEKLGIDELPCVQVTGWTDAQKKAYVIADNKLALNAGWDESILALEFDALEELGFDLEMTGFTLDEIAEIRPEDLNEGLTDEDAVPEAPDQPVTIEGDIWILGEHRLMCGDSTDAGSVALLMGGQKADMVFTDPPYRMQVEGGSNQPIGRAAAKLGEAIKHLCEFDPIKFLEVLPTVFKKGHNSYIFCNKDLVPDYLNWANEKGFSFNILFWKKPNAIPLGKQHRPDVEYLLVFRKSAHWNDGIKGVNYSKCLEYGREIGLHPTMKPVSMIENQLLISSPPNGEILDFFLGSGSTLIACEKTGRKCYGMELDPKYCDVIIKRWQDFTGKKATMAGDTFEDVAAARGVDVKKAA